jgi:hypothetical protein
MGGNSLCSDLRGNPELLSKSLFPCRRRSPAVAVPESLVRRRRAKSHVTGNNPPRHRRPSPGHPAPRRAPPISQPRPHVRPFRQGRPRLRRAGGQARHQRRNRHLRKPRRLQARAPSRRRPIRHQAPPRQRGNDPGDHRAPRKDLLAADLSCTTEVPERLFTICDELGIEIDFATLPGQYLRPDPPDPRANHPL